MESLVKKFIEEHGLPFNEHGQCIMVSPDGKQEINLGVILSIYGDEVLDKAKDLNKI